MYKELIHTGKSNDNTEKENLIKNEVESLEDFDKTRVEPYNFVRQSLLGYDECLSYL